MIEKILWTSLLAFIALIGYHGYKDVKETKSKESQCNEMNGAYLKDMQGKHFCIVNDKLFSL